MERNEVSDYIFAYYNDGYMPSSQPETPVHEPVSPAESQLQVDSNGHFWAVEGEPTDVELLAACLA